MHNHTQEQRNSQCQTKVNNVQTNSCTTASTKATKIILDNAKHTVVLIIGRESFRFRKDLHKHKKEIGTSKTK